MGVNSTLAPFHQVDMLSYIKDEHPCVPTTLRIMDAYCSRKLEEIADLIPSLSEDEFFECYLDDMDILARIKDLAWAFIDGQLDPHYFESFYVPKWFLVELLRYMCKNHTSEGYDICFVIELLRQCK